ncbi:MAG TPA: hypothetical protein VFV85_08660, partial [Conexibacter sp.]|nr:hypothetical protein [Conexibacter sp.]
SRRAGLLVFALVAAALCGGALLLLDRHGDRDRWTATATGHAPRAHSADPPAPAPARSLVARLPDDPRWLAPDSVFNALIPRDAPLDPASGGLVRRLAREAHRASTVNATRWSTPVYRVGPAQPTVRVQLDAGDAPDLQAALERVPLPPDARAAAGTDGDVVVVQESSDTAWELWRMRRDAGGGVHARWAGVVHPLSQHPGAFRDVPAPGGGWRERWFWGITAAKLVKLGGLLTARELASGRIDHALAIATPNPRARVFAAPAQGTDGDGPAADALPEGARLRLDPALDLDALHLPPLTLALARAAQRYGLVVNNRTGSTVAFYAEDPKGLGFDPYPAIFRGTSPWQVAHAFPWDRLQVLKMSLRSSAAGVP